MTGLKLCLAASTVACPGTRRAWQWLADTKPTTLPALEPSMGAAPSVLRGCGEVCRARSLADTAEPKLEPGPLARVTAGQITTAWRHLGRSRPLTGRKTLPSRRRWFRQSTLGGPPQQGGCGQTGGA